MKSAINLMQCLRKSGESTMSDGRLFSSGVGRNRGLTLEKSIDLKRQQEAE